MRVAVVSAADPVDRETGRLVELPDAPFLVGALDPPAVLAELVDGPVTVDNDVNWAARAEHGRVGLRLRVPRRGRRRAVVSDGEVRRGHAGLAGEIAHVPTAGPGGAAMRLTEVFDALGLRRPGSTAIDVPALLRAVEPERGRRAWRARSAGVLSAAVALADPGGRAPRRPVGPRSGRARRDRARVRPGAAPRPGRSRAVDDEPALAGARETALGSCATRSSPAARPGFQSA